MFIFGNVRTLKVNIGPLNQIELKFVRAHLTGMNTWIN